MHPVKQLKSKKGRDGTGLFIIEGEKFVDEIPAEWKVRRYCFSKSFAEDHDLSRYGRRAECEILRDTIFDSVSDTAAPQGILAVCEQRTFLLNSVLGENCFLLLGENLSDPGNIGTLIRTAAAAGADGIILSKGSGEVYNPKVLRAAAGAALRIPVVTGVEIEDAAAQIKGSANGYTGVPDKQPKSAGVPDVRPEHTGREEKNTGQNNCAGISIYAAHPRGKVYPYSLDLRKGFCFMVGNEARGLSGEAIALADALVKLPMPGKTESLNASMAGGVLMYEAVRQRIQI